jgi:hypothetical protein
MILLKKILYELFFWTTVLAIYVGVILWTSHVGVSEAKKAGLM